MAKWQRGGLSPYAGSPEGRRNKYVIFSIRFEKPEKF